MNKIVPAMAYQGGKARLAAAIVDRIDDLAHRDFYDLCCGSGAVSIELINRGVSPSRITMCDRGPWGEFWRQVGDGSFDVAGFHEACGRVPQDKGQITDYMRQVFAAPVRETWIHDFLILQAATFGGAAVWRDDSGRWQKAGGFRSFWQPTATSNRRSHVNPMMPMPDTLAARVEQIAVAMRGVRGVYGDAAEIRAPRGSVAYIDPPYAGTCSYGFQFDAVAYAENSQAVCYISEGWALSDNAVLLTPGTLKGGMNGERSKPHAEWLSRFEPQAVAC